MNLIERVQGRLDALTGRGSTSMLRYDLLVAFGGHLAEKLLAVGGGFLILWALSPSEYGIYTGAMSALAIASRFTDFGLETGTVRLVAKARRAGRPEDERRVLKAVFLAKLALSGFMFAVGWVTAPLVAGPLLDRSWLVPYLRLVYAALFGKQLTGFFKSLFGGRLEFVHNAVFLAVGPLLLLVGLFGSYRIGKLTVPACIGLNALAPLLAVLAALVYTGRSFLRGPTGGLGTLAGIWRFSRWIYLTDAVSTLRFQAANLLLLRLSTSSVAGLYGAGDRLASGVSLLTNTVLTVFVPRASQFGSRSELQELLRKSNRWLLWLAASVPFIPFTARPVVSILKPEYLPSAPIFAVLLISMLFSVATLPSRSVLYSVSRPQAETLIEIVALALTLVLCVWLIPRHGGIGAAVAMLIQRALSAAALMGWVHYKVRCDPSWTGGEG